MSAASSTLLLAAALLSPAGAGAPPETGASTAAALSDLVPAHHPLRGFAGEVACNEHRPHPELRYQRPDFEAWASGLEEATIDPGRDHFIAIWRTADGAIRYVLSRAERVRLFTVEGNTTEFERVGPERPDPY